MAADCNAAGHAAVIGLQFCDPRPLAGSPVLATYWQMLSPPERAQHQRLRHAADRLRYLVTRALVRTALSELTAVPPEQWQFGQTRHGKPVVTHPAVLPAGLDFSVSHTDELIVLALHHHGAVGVDAERWVDRAPPLEVCPLLLTPAEQQALRGLPAKAQPQRFFQYWTLKEAHVKALGTGLSHPLTAFSFGFDSAQTLRFHSPGHPACPWDFWLFDWRSHSVAVCAQAQHDPATLSARAVVPLIDSTALALPEAWSTSNTHHEGCLDRDVALEAKRA